MAAPRPEDLPGWLAGPRRRWSAEVMGLELPWYAEMKREQGAFATLLGLGVLRPTADRPGKWRAVAVGDSCLFRVRGGGRCSSFPIRKAADFGNQPRSARLARRAGAGSGTCLRLAASAGDRLLLMTDALAQWFLRAYEGGGRPWEAVASVLSARSRTKRSPPGSRSCATATGCATTT